MFRKEIIAKMVAVERDVFEEALRDIRRVAYGRTGAIVAKSLIDQCASREHVRDDDIRNAHDVRKYRNSIVHGGTAAQVSVPTARKWLCTFFGWMPKQW